MAVKGPQEDVIHELEAAREALGRAEAAVMREVATFPGLTMSEVAERFHVSEEAIMAFVETVASVIGERTLDADTARRAALVAVAGQAWEDELGPLLSSGEVRKLLDGVSRQRVDELLKSKRLIGLRDSGGRRRYPAFQFLDGQPLQSLIAAFWTLADAAIDEWTAASWCVSSDETMDGQSPLDLARTGRTDLLGQVARQDAARLAA
jgi:hypothetical protein